MNQKEFAVEFNALLDSMRDLVTAKNNDYAGADDPLANLRMCEKASIAAWKGIAAVRMADKMSRILNFCRTEDFKVKSENLEDTLIDIANYALICIIAYREQKTKSANNQVDK